MFSVGATPYNSKARQLYGGWTLEQAGDNPWATRTWHTMSAKYNPDIIARQNSKMWLKAYAELPRDLRKRFAREGRPYWNKAILPALSDDQKAEIFNAFEGVPLSEDDAWAQFRSNTLRRAPYPAISVLNTWPFTTAPRSAKIENMADLTGLTAGPYRRTLANMWTAARANRRANRQALINARRRQLEQLYIPQVPQEYLNAPAAPDEIGDEERARVLRLVNAGQPVV